MRACVRACVRVCVRGRVLATVRARISASEGVCMHANERGRVQIRRERERAREHMSAWVRACERRRGCVHASTSVVARSMSATSMRSLNTAASARFSFASSFVVSRSAMASLVSSSIVFLRELADVILHLRGDLTGRLGKREELGRLVDFGLHGPGRQPAVERAL